MSERRSLILWTSALLGATALVFFINPSEHHLIPCLFRTITGWQCPGCGMTRAAHACLNASWTEAWHFNPFIYVMIPGVFVSMTRRWVYHLRGQTIRPIRIPTAFNVIACIILLAFMVLRNLSPLAQ